MLEITVAMHSNITSGLRSIDFKMGGSNFDLNSSHETKLTVKEHCRMNSCSGRVLQAMPSFIKTSKNGSLKLKQINTNITKYYITFKNTLYLLARFISIDAIDLSKYDSITSK